MSLQKTKTETLAGARGEKDDAIKVPTPKREAVKTSFFQKVIDFVKSAIAFLTGKKDVINIEANVPRRVKETSASADINIQAQVPRK